MRHQVVTAPTARQQRRLGSALVYVAIVGLVALAAWFFIDQRQEDIEEAIRLQGIAQRTSQIAALQSKTANLSSELEKQRLQFEACKDKPVGTAGCTAPVSLPPEQVQPDVTVDTSPTIDPEQVQSQLRVAVADYFEANPPAPGADGKTPNAEEVADSLSNIVTSYFVANPPPSGTDGTNGTNGQNGTNGEDGADAPPPTQEQVNNAVVSLCTASPAICQSTVAGPPGTPGEDGTDAPRVTTIDCSGGLLTDGLTFTITYDTGETRTVTCSNSGGTPE